MSRSDDSESIPEDQAYWSVVERMLDGFYRCTLDGHIVRVSPRAVRVIGYDSEDELIGKVTMAELWVYPSERDLLLAELREHGEVRGFEATLKTRDGGRVRVEMTVAPWRGENGEILGTDGVIRDVTAHSRSEQQFRSLIRNSPGAIFRFIGGVRRRYTFMSEAIEGITGYPPEHFTSNENPMVTIIHPEDRRVAETLKAVSVEPGEHYSFEFRILTPASETRWIRMQGGGATDRTTGVALVDGVILDVTELHEALEAAEQANRAKSTFLANMSHELRTPLNAILGYSEMLMEDSEDSGDSDTAEDLRKIHRSGAHLLSLINDVLDLAKIESGKMEALAEDFEVARLLDDVTATAQPLMGKNDNELRVARGDTPLGTAHQDLTKMRQSLLNLLSNAAKFTHEGTVVLRAARETVAGTDWLTLSVQDSGIGIAEDKVALVFDEFAQAEDHTSRNYGGTGLGLPISRRFCRMLGGDLSLESRPGEGSTFTIRVPAVLPGAEVDEPAASAPERSDAELASLREASSGRTVLVIDDDPEARDIIERLLRSDDLAVVTAASGAEGLRLAHGLRPAVITLDVMMPDMDGWSVLRALKADPELRDVPVVMLSILDDKARGYSLGATDYLVKPIDRDALRGVVHRHASSSEPGHALVVDDDTSVREAVGRTLGIDGWQVREAENGRAALDQLSTFRPGLILLDLMMPVMDGFDFLLELRANADWRDIPVVVLTAMDLTAEDRRVLGGRVEQIVAKDTWSHDQLAALVHRAVRRGEPRA